MARPPLFVGFNPPEHVRQILDARRPIRYGALASPSREDIAADIGDAQAAIVVASLPFSAETIERLPSHLKVLATYSVGYDHINVAAAQARGLVVLNTPDVLSNSVAECALFLMLGVARRATESIDLVRSRQWKGWTPNQLLGFELEGKRLGIFGMGRIGLSIARKATALGMEISYHNRRPNDAATEQGYAYEPDFARFLGGIDMLVLAAPSTPETRGIMGAQAFARMRKGASIVNIARGDLIDDDALIAALASGHLAGAGLDVFNKEPAIHPGYFDLPNVVMLPHAGSSTREARAGMINLLLDGIEKAERGERPDNQVSL
jgi:lactate dehydrogenase-like 2-hydroxyacid dehydrogenase